MLPFTNQAGSQDVEYLAQGLTDGIVNTLGHLASLQVRGRTAIPQFRKTQPDARAVGDMLHVGAVLSGSIVEKDGALLVRAELVDTHTAAHLWGDSYQRKASEIGWCKKTFARKSPRSCASRLRPMSENRCTGVATTNPAAEQLYLQGRFFWNRRTAEDFKTATDYFNRAIDLDPDYALPYAGLADVLITQSGSSPKQVMPQAELNALKAINKDEELAAAHVALASIKLNYEWDWLQTEKEYKRAIELDPSLLRRTPGTRPIYGLWRGSTRHWQSQGGRRNWSRRPFRSVWGWPARS